MSLAPQELMQVRRHSVKTGKLRLALTFDWNAVKMLDFPQAYIRVDLSTSTTEPVLQVKVREEDSRYSRELSS